VPVVPQGLDHPGPDRDMHARNKLGDGSGIAMRGRWGASQRRICMISSYVECDAC